MEPMFLPRELESAINEMGARVLAVRLLEEYKRYINRILFITCFDDRFQAAMAEFIKILAKERDRSDRIEALRLPLPGTGLIMLNDNPKHRDWLLSELLQWAFEIQTAGEVYLVAHIDCGAFGGSKAFNYDFEAEMDHHKNELNKAREVIQGRFPGVIVHIYVAVFKKETGINRGIVDFVNVSKVDGETIISVESSFSRKHVAKKVIVACPDTIMRKTTHDQFGDGMHFRLNVPGGSLFFNQTDDHELIKHLLGVPILKCNVKEILSLSHPGCTCSQSGFYPFLNVVDKISHFVNQGNAARHVIYDLFPEVTDLKVRPIFGHSFTHEGVPTVAYIES